MNNNINALALQHPAQIAGVAVSLTMAAVGIAKVAMIAVSLFSELSLALSRTHENFNPNLEVRYGLSSSLSSAPSLKEALSSLLGTQLDEWNRIGKEAPEEPSEQLTMKQVNEINEAIARNLLNGDYFEALRLNKFNDRLIDLMNSSETQICQELKDWASNKETFETFNVATAEKQIDENKLKNLVNVCAEAVIKENFKNYLSPEGCYNLKMHPSLKERIFKPLLVDAIRDCLGKKYLENPPKEMDFKTCQKLEKVKEEIWGSDPTFMKNVYEIIFSDMCSKVT